jgi:hypothetical protein
MVITRKKARRGGNSIRSEVDDDSGRETKKNEENYTFPFNNAEAASVYVEADERPKEPEYTRKKEVFAFPFKNEVFSFPLSLFSSSKSNSRFLFIFRVLALRNKIDIDHIYYGKDEYHEPIYKNVSDFLNFIPIADHESPEEAHGRHNAIIHNLRSISERSQLVLLKERERTSNKTLRFIKNIIRNFTRKKQKHQESKALKLLDIYKILTRDDEKLNQKTNSKHISIQETAAQVMIVDRYAHEDVYESMLKGKHKSEKRKKYKEIVNKPLRPVPVPVPPKVENVVRKYVDGGEDEELNRQKLAAYIFLELQKKKLQKKKYDDTKKLLDHQDEYDDDDADAKIIEQINVLQNLLAEMLRTQKDRHAKKAQEKSEAKEVVKCRLDLNKTVDNMVKRGDPDFLLRMKKYYLAFSMQGGGNWFFKPKRIQSEAILHNFEKKQKDEEEKREKNEKEIAFEERYDSIKKELEGINVCIGTIDSHITKSRGSSGSFFRNLNGLWDSRTVNRIKGLNFLLKEIETARNEMEYKERGKKLMKQQDNFSMLTIDQEHSSDDIEI